MVNLIHFCFVIFLLYTIQHIHFTFIHQFQDQLTEQSILPCKPGEGIGGPHIGYDMVWPMSIMMKAFTSKDDAEIKSCIEMLMNTDAGTGFMHESFHKDNPEKFTRAWFAWQNTLFGELILKLF